MINFWKETGNNADDAMNETTSFFIVLLCGIVISGFSMPFIFQFINYFISLI